MERTIPSGASVRQKPRRRPLWLLGVVDWIEWGFARLGGRRFYRAFHLRTGRFRERHEEIFVVDLPTGLDGLTIAQLSDIHAGEFMGEGDLCDVVRSVNERGVDIVALTGDFICHHVTEAQRLTADLADLRSRFGTFAVFGNHDYYGRREDEIVSAFEPSGVRFLRNEGVRLDTGNGVLYLSGVEDLEEAKHIDPQAARADLQAGDIEVFLCHNPGGAEGLAREGCVAVLSGHTHGGQLNIPGVPSPGQYHPGDRLQFGPTTSIVSHGLGVVAVPLRFRAPAEVVFVTLRAGAV